ncbi:MAG: DUF2335 domain-containing protein, partial [Nitrospirae bacterium]|nr:DUF2335 domain-containing protein [Nitrospirota bacterium]
MRPRSRKSEALADTINKNQTVAHNTQPNISYSTVIVDSPFPDPKILQKYKEILPGLAEKIISLAENEQRMRHEIDIANIELEKEAT